MALCNSSTATRSQSIAQAMKRKWQDPQYRRKMSVYYAKRRQDPVKAWSRRGVPNGYHRNQAELMWRECRARAEAAVDAIEANEGERLSSYAREALVEVIAILRSPLNDVIRLKAARLLLEFTRPKPARNQRVSIGTAEDWLDLLTAEGLNRPVSRR